MRVAVAGAGVGGLTLALAVASRGGEAVVCERAPRLRAAGAGVQLGPNAVKALDGLGLGEALRAVAFAPESAEVRQAFGRARAAAHRARRAGRAAVGRALPAGAPRRPAGAAARRRRSRLPDHAAAGRGGAWGRTPAARCGSRTGPSWRPTPPSAPTVCAPRWPRRCTGRRPTLHRPERVARRGPARGGGRRDSARGGGLGRSRAPPRPLPRPRRPRGEPRGGDGGRGLARRLVDRARRPRRAAGGLRRLARPRARAAGRGAGVRRWALFDRPPRRA